MQLIIHIVLVIVQPALLLTLSQFVVGLIRKVKARLQCRRGASLFQPYADLAKLFREQPVISSTTSWIFTAATYIVFASTVAAGLLMPVFVSHTPLNFAGNIIALVYLLALGTFFLILAGLDAGSAFGGMGSSREASTQPMPARRHSILIMSTSSAGLHGLHGLSSYSAAKVAVIGLTRALAQEGQSRSVLVNAVAPYASTQMTPPHASQEFQATMDAALVAPLVALLVSSACPISGQVIVAGKGAFRRAATIEGLGLAYRARAELTPERLADNMHRILDMTDAREYADAFASFQEFFASTAGVD